MKLSINQTVQKKELSDYDTMNMYILVTAINLAVFAIAELEPHKMGGVHKMRYLNLRHQLNNFLIIMTGKSSKEDKNRLANHSFDSVASIAELMAMVAMVHPEQQDWYLSECKKLVYQSVNRQAGIV